MGAEGGQTGIDCPAEHNHDRPKSESGWLQVLMREAGGICGPIFGRGGGANCVLEWRVADTDVPACHHRWLPKVSQRSAARARTPPRF